MSDHAGLNVYQIAYVCGGPARVVLVALVGLYEDGHITIDPARHHVLVHEHDQYDPVRAAVTGLVPDAGRVLGPLREAAARTEPVAGVRRTLRARGLLPRSRIARLWPSPRACAARDLRRRLVAGLPAAPDTARRVATMGTAGIGDPVLREIVEQVAVTPVPGGATRP